MLEPGFEAALTAALREDQLVRQPEQLRTYECDGLTGRRVVPALVVLAESTADVAFRRLVHLSGSHHTRIQFDLAKCAFVTGHILLQDGGQRLRLLRA